MPNVRKMIRYVAYHLPNRTEFELNPAITMFNVIAGYYFIRLLLY